MELTTHSQQGIPVLKLSGRFDAHEAPTVAKWFEDNQQASRVVVDLGGVTFIDSSGLSALVKGLKRCRQDGGDVHLCALQQPVVIIFELTRLDKAFSIHPDEAAALQAFSMQADPLKGQA